MPGASQEKFAFVEGNAGLRIDLAEIESVTIRKIEAAKGTDWDTLLRQMAEPEPPKSQNGPSGRVTDLYDVVILLNDAGATKLKNFPALNVGNLIDVRISGRRISIAKVWEPTTGNGFTLNVISSPDELRQLFSPVGRKLWWQ